MDGVPAWAPLMQKHLQVLAIRGPRALLPRERSSQGSLLREQILELECSRLGHPQWQPPVFSELSRPRCSLPGARRLLQRVVWAGGRGCGDRSSALGLMYGGSPSRLLGGPRPSLHGGPTVFTGGEVGTGLVRIAQGLGTHLPRYPLPQRRCTGQTGPFPLSCWTAEMKVPSKPLIPSCAPRVEMMLLLESGLLSGSGFRGGRTLGKSHPLWRPQLPHC